MEMESVVSDTRNTVGVHPPGMAILVVSGMLIEVIVGTDDGNGTWGLE